MASRAGARRIRGLWTEPALLQPQVTPATFKSANGLLDSLLDYILEQARQVNPKGFRLSAHTDFKASRSRVAGLPGVELNCGIDTDPVWLRIPRLTENKPPAIADRERASLVRIPGDPTALGPTVNDAGVQARVQALVAQEQAQQGADGEEEAGGRPPVSAERLAQLTEQVRAEAQALLGGYLPLWKSWAEAEKPRRRTIALYGEFFALSQRLADDTANPCELVWGIGIATWQMPSSEGPIAFEYPLITQELEVGVNDKTFTIELTPRVASPRLEVDAFVACDLPSAVATDRAVRKSWEAPEAPQLSPFVGSSYSPALKSVANNLDKQGAYLEVKDANTSVPLPGESLVVTDDWVLLARPKRTSYLEEDVRRLKQALSTLKDVPDGPKSLVTKASNFHVELPPITFRGLSSSSNRGSGAGAAGAGGEVRELYFPAPYNDEQVTIVQQLEHAPGVTVQGPPGTGKTHTIANIICHYLATGRRVLVTSAGEPALRVLQQKVPEEVRALSVALVASDREGMKQFEASIQEIQAKVSQLNERATREDIERASKAIDLAHAEINQIDRRVDEIARAQLADVEVDGVPMKAGKLAELVVSGRESCGWFEDEVTLAPEHAPPLTEEGAALARSARRKLGRDLAYVGHSIPVADNFPPAAEIARLHGVLVRIKALDAQAQAVKSSLKDTEPETLAAAARLLERLEEARALAKDLEAHTPDWPVQLRLKCLASSFNSEREALEALFAELDALVDDRAAFLKRPVEFPEAGLACPKTKEAVARGAQTGKPFGFMSFVAGAAKEHVPAIKVSALEPRSADDWQHVQRYLQLHEKVLVVSSRWNIIADLLGLPTFNGGVKALRTIESTGQLARKAHRLAMEFDRRLADEAREVLLEVVESEFKGPAEQLAKSHRTLQNHLTRTELAGAAVAKVSLHAKLDGKSGPVVNELIAFLETSLGNEALSPEDAALAYDRLMAELRRLAELAQPLALVKTVTDRIEAAGAPALASRVRTRAVPAAGDDTALPANWREAWNWARVRRHLDAIEARDELVKLAERRRTLEQALSKLYKRMVSQAAWLATKKAATGAVMAALNGYATAMQRLGKGTGTNAARYRRNAREAMLEAAAAVPCWIMSHARVSEAMPPEIGAFDLVIVDEASQSNLWALPAILRAKKILVVGDNKQVSPTAGFIEAARIDELYARFLSEQPYGVEMTPEKSLYELAARVYGGSQVMLREHFRCVPAIIAYSNREFYQGNIQPLRIAKGSERIDPPLVDLYVPGGVRSRKDINDAEAQAIAAEIQALIADERFAKRTIGVVTLMGTAQAKHIDQVVRAKCDLGELVRRKFEVGDAPTFQGSERDIIFLSMVVDPSNCHAVAGLTYEQRFNVAGSRARDRMYLVRSVQMNELSPADVLRRALLEHFEKPMVTQDEPAAELIDCCESGFERDVFGTLTGLGYRVVPQVPSGAYRIDMVVEGDGDRRLAIECDGDDFHGPDRWDADMRRQRVLERAGWTFWRCFASTWTMKRDEVLRELLDTLEAMGIEPIGALEKAPLLVERRTWTPPAPENGGATPEQGLLEGMVAEVRGAAD
jgi:very-short-patch-repair endonuclease